MQTRRALALSTATFAFVLAVCACTRQAPTPAACIDAGTVRIRVSNDGATPMQVPQARPDIGCCSRSGLTIAVTDAAGRDLDRCGFADNFDLGRVVELQPGASIEYAVSAQTLSKMYCQVDLRRHYLSVHDGTRPLGTHPLQPCGEAPTERKPQAR